MIINTTPSDMQYFSSDQIDAPKMMGNSNGDMLQVLDACLLHGWGSKIVQSATLSDNIATLHFGVSHGFLNRQRVLVTGFTDQALDGVYRTTLVSQNKISINMPSAINLDGVLTVKLAPLGWESLFGSSDPLKRAYRSNGESLNINNVLFLDMSYPDPSPYHTSAPAKRAMVKVCEDMEVLGSPIGDMTANANLSQSNPNGSLFWYQKRGGSTTSGSSSVPSTPSKWRIVGNGDVFFFMIGWSGSGAADQNIFFDIFSFGKFADLSNGLEKNTFLTAILNPNDNTVAVGGAGLLGSNIGSSVYVFNSEGNAVSATREPIKSNSKISGSTVPFPSSYGNAIFATPYRIYLGNELRGYFYSFMYLDSAPEPATYGTTVIDDILIIPAPSAMSNSSSSLSSVCFYIGD